MVFSSLTFIYIFFPIVFILYFAVKNRTWRNAVLLTASLVFYSWGEPKLLVLMLLATLEAYLGGLAIARLKGTKKRAVFWVTAILLIGNLFVFKYFNFAVNTVTALTELTLSVPEIVLPIGISFYTFQILSYVIDLYWERVAVQKNYFLLLLYVSLFPQLIAGPIVRYQTVEDEIKNRSENLTDIAEGMRRFIIGLSKKVILANTLGTLAETVYAGSVNIFGGAMYWLAALAYTMQIYFDFSGYSDMAIGLGRVFGFHFLENFDYPYVSCSVTEFWRRWHISLSSWFRDYVYIPLGGNRVSRPRWILNIMVVWATTGLWHGASWNFVLWGLYYGVILLLEKLFLHKLLNKLPKLCGWLYTMAIVVVGWVLFNMTDFGALSEALKIMFTMPHTDLAGVINADSSLLMGLIWLPTGALCCLPITKKLPQKDSTAATVISYCACGILAFICIVFLLSNSYNPFIYFRF